jgi:ketosteroid isomerase-like protein
VRATPQTLDWIRGYYELMDADRLEECEQYFAPDATIRIAHHPPLQGWDAIDRSMRAGLSVVQGIRHEVLNAWEAEDGVLIFEVVAHYTLKDDRHIDVPGVVIADVADGRFQSQRIGADLSAVYGNL